MCDTTCYCTFWYPTIFHQELERLYPPDKILENDISDGSEKKHDISIILDKEENLIVTFSYKEQQEDKKFTVPLKRTKYHRNGFVQYSFDKKNIPHFEEFKTILCKDVYHLAKEFYHIHEADGGKDGALRGIITPVEGGIDGDDNPFLIGFLKDFAPVFEFYAESISRENREVQKREKKLQKIEEELKKLQRKKEELKSLQKFEEAKQLEKSIEDIRKTVKINRYAIFTVSLVVNRLCENACIEYTYCKTLLSSIYNKSFIHSLEFKEKKKEDGSYKNSCIEYTHCKTLITSIKNKSFTHSLEFKEEDQEEKKKEWRRQALNIRNSIRYVENIKYKNQNRLSKLAQNWLDEVNGVSNEVKDVTNEVKTNTNEVKANTEHIKFALQQGKRAEKMNYTLAFLSVYLSLALGFPYNNFLDVDKFIIPSICLTIHAFIYIIIAIGFSVFITILLIQKRAGKKIVT